MSRPKPIAVMHFTRVEHLETTINFGLRCDTHVKASGLLAIEVGNAGIKDNRSHRTVPVTPGGVVADYVPFYFAPRSPMLYSITRGNVPTYDEGTDRIVYVVSAVETLRELGIDVVLTDRNAVLRFAEFVNLADGEPPADFIDWPLMKEQYWHNTLEDPSRRERRMAECLAHNTVPWAAFSHVVAKTKDVATEVEQLLARAGEPQRVLVRPTWYF